MSERWTQVESMLRERAYRTLGNDPQILLEHDGGPSGAKADLILARLIGFDDQIVEDGVRLSQAVPTLLRPLVRRPLLLEEDAGHYPSTVTATARYELQSGSAKMSVDALDAPPEVKIDPSTLTFTVLYLRYRRRT